MKERILLSKHDTFQLAFSFSDKSKPIMVSVLSAKRTMLLDTMSDLLSPKTLLKPFTTLFEAVNKSEYMGVIEWKVRGF